MTAEFNILLSSAGRRVALLDIYRRTLAELGVPGRIIATDKSPLSSAFHSADRAHVVPPCTAPDFIPAMLEICDAEGVRLVVPTIDPELPVFAGHRHRFAEIGATVAVSSAATIAVGADKQMTHQWLLGEGFSTVNQASVEQVLSEADAWPFPLMVKPRRGSASRGVTVVRDEGELVAASRRNGECVVQTLARGAEHTIDILADSRGRCVCAVPRRRLEVRDGESSKGITVRSDALEKLARRLCERLPGAYGVLNVQAFVDDGDGEPSVIEINPRFGGGFPLTWEAGGKYPRWMIEEILGLPSTASPQAWDEGVVMLRYDEAVFVRRAAAGL